MMPTPRHTPRFDTRPAVARLQTDSTDMLRTLHPDLAWVWDELEELRDETDARTEKLDTALARVNKLLDEMLADIDLMEPVDIRDRLDAIAEFVEEERIET